MPPYYVAGIGHTDLQVHLKFALATPAQTDDLPAAGDTTLAHTVGSDTTLAHTTDIVAADTVVACNTDIVAVLLHVFWCCNT